MTNKRQKATKVKCKRDESITKQSIFMEYPDDPPRETSTSGEERGETAVFAGLAYSWQQLPGRGALPSNRLIGMSRWMG